MKYIVNRIWKIEEAYEIKAESEEEAKNNVSYGEGYLLSEDWTLLETNAEEME